MFGTKIKLDTARININAVGNKVDNIKKKK